MEEMRTNESDSKESACTALLQLSSTFTLSATSIKHGLLRRRSCLLIFSNFPSAEIERRKFALEVELGAMLGDAAHVQVFLSAQAGFLSLQ